MSESALDRVLDSFEQAAQECIAEGDWKANVTVAAVDQARAELSALRKRIAELEPPRGSTAALYLLSAGDPEC